MSSEPEGCGVPGCSVGDRVRVRSRKGLFEGVVMPRTATSGEGVLVLKLDSGYNIGLRMDDHAEVEVVEHASSPRERGELRSDTFTLGEGGKRVTIIHTGGTIASRVDYRTGGVVARFTPEEMLDMFPELRSVPGLGELRSVFLRNMFSENVRFAHINLMAEAVAEALSSGGSDAVIVTHGTDTMHYTAAGLSFVLEGLDAPVLLVGSQRSSDRPSSDAGMNLVCAVRFACGSEYAGVAICMHASGSDAECMILPPTRTRKMHTSRRDAFTCINDTPYALVRYPSLEMTPQRTYPRPGGEGGLTLRRFREDIRVGMLRVHVNLLPEEVRAFRGFDGLIIEGTGLGHMPITRIDDESAIHASIREELEALIGSGCIVVMTSQTVFGRIDMKVYSTGRDLLSLGVLGDDLDICPETAFMKLAWLLSNFPREQVGSMVSRDVRGELGVR